MGAPGGSGVPNPLSALLGPDAAAPGNFAAGLGPFGYGGIGATDNATTGLARYGGIPGAPSGTGQDLLSFMQGQMNAFNQRTGSHLSISADYPGGPLGHPDDGADHSVRRAMDFSGSQKDMDAFAAYVANNPALRGATRQLIHNPAGDTDPNNPFNLNMNIIGGHLTSGPGTYGTGDQGMGGHGNHDHWALQYIPGQGFVGVVGGAARTDRMGPNLPYDPNRGAAGNFNPAMKIDLSQFRAPQAAFNMDQYTDTLLSGARDLNDPNAAGNPPLVSSGSNVSIPTPAPGGIAGMPGMNVAGDYMPMYVVPSAIDPKPAIHQFQQQQNAQVRSAGGFGGVHA